VGSNAQSYISGKWKFYTKKKANRRQYDRKDGRNSNSVPIEYIPELTKT